MQEYRYIAENYRILQEKVKNLADKAGRDVKLVAVTKSGDDAELLALADAGML